MEDDTDYELLTAIQEIRAAEIEVTKAETSLMHAKEDLLRIMIRRSKKTLSTTYGSTSFKSTIVKSETMKIDDEGLRAHVGKRTFSKLCVQKVDKNKIAEAVSRGVVQLEDISPYMTITARQPYVRITTSDVVEEVSE